MFSSTLRRCLRTMINSRISFDKLKIHTDANIQSSRIYSTQSVEDQTSQLLTRFIKQKIRFSGPITVADFMRMTVSAPQTGYYQKFSRKKKVFGEFGDFITAPELSQMFGELIGIWCYYEKMHTGYQEHWQLVESGPGTGQLMVDVLRTLRSLKEDNFSIHLVEVSDTLIMEQERLLCDYQSAKIDNCNYIKENKTKCGIPIYWYRSIDDIPDKFSIFICNEFLDALPIHQFKRDEKGIWHEVYITLDENDNLCFMLSMNENLHSIGLIPENIRKDASRTEWEICPDAGTYINQIVEHIKYFGGFGLMIDYGHNGCRNNFSLRAYHQHKLVNPLDNLGEQDLTADVNFGYLRSLVEDRTLVYGAIEQRHFMAQMGINVRLSSLIQKCSDDIQRKCILDSYKILMSESAMGSRFKLMSVFPKTLDEIMELRNGPVGFALNTDS